MCASGPTQESDKGDDVYTVLDLTRRVSDVLGDEPDLQDVDVIGEVSSFTHHSGSGHMYFELKDDDAVLNCVMFRFQNQRLGFEPEDGVEVVASGDIDVYEARGQYQLIVGDMSKAGWGDLHLEYLRLKERLKDEGLFVDRLKKEVPRYPRRVGVVTSESGAALHDIMDVLDRRFPVEVILAPARVQGDGSEHEIAAAVECIDRENVDVVIVGRGGGSLEDLWSFNEEVVARAVFECETPVVSAVGHEVDVTIVDHVADERAATPSEAAEIVVPSRDEVELRIDDLESRMSDRVRAWLDRLSSRVESHRRVLERGPDMVRNLMQRIDALEDSMGRAVDRDLERRGDRVEDISRRLDSLSPLKVLGRGYSVSESKDGVVSSVDSVGIGWSMETRVVDGVIESEVTDKQKDDA